MRIPTALLLTILSCRMLPAQDLTGYFKNFSHAMHLPRGTAVDRTLWQISNRIRLKYSHSFGHDLAFDAAWEVSPRQQDPALLRANPYGFNIDASSYYRAVDFRARLYPGSLAEPGHTSLYQNLDRFALTWKSPRADITVGRQAIAWGSARVINPTDVIAPFAFTALDKEEVPGVDALRVRIPTGSLSEIDLGYIPGRHFKLESSAFFMRSRTSLLQTDLVLLVAGMRENLLLGVDVARSLGQTGFTMEAAFVDPGRFNHAFAGRSYFRMSAGADRSLTRRIYGYLEYHYNSAGADEPGDYAQLFDQPAYRTGSVYLLGRHYISLGANLQVSPLHTLNILSLTNLRDGSISLFPTWEYNATANSYLSFGAVLGLGDGPVSSSRLPAASSLQYGSEFGSYPDLVYASYRYYF